MLYFAIHLIRSIRNNLFAREIEWLNNNLNSNILLELYALRKKCKFIPKFSKKRTVCIHKYMKEKFKYKKNNIKNMYIVLKNLFLEIKRKDYKKK